MRAAVLLLLLAVLLGGPPALSAQTELSVAFWNVENLFDLQDDPQVELDEEFTPGSEKAWTEERLRIKLQNLARVISDMNDGRGPDLLGLAEIENRWVVEQLVKELAKLKRDWQIIHRESNSERGIDTALLWDRRRVQLDAHQFHSFSGIRTRDVVEATFHAGPHRFVVFVNHWPSQRSPEEVRVQVAAQLRRRIDGLLQQDRQADLLIIGDLNEYPDDEALAQTLRAGSTSDRLTDGALFNSMHRHHTATSGTYVYENKWGVLDHIILSPGLLDTRGVGWVKDSSQPVKFDYQMFQLNRPGALARPSRSYSGPRFHRDGYSDHLPVICRLRVPAS